MSLAPVSVVVPCWQAEATLERAVASVLSQSWLPAELILVDDSSSDSTPNVIARCCALETPVKVRGIRVMQNSGPGAARNAGWEASTQPLIAFLDADDAWHPQKLEIQVAYMLQHPEVSLTGTQSVIHDPSVAAPLGALQVREITPLQMLISNRILTRTAMLRSTLPNRFASRRFAEDFLLWLELVLSGRSAVLLEVPLAFTFRAEYAGGGYSSQLWRHELRELRTLRRLMHGGLLSPWKMALAAGWSLVKYLRRVVIARRRARA